MLNAIYSNSPYKNHVKHQKNIAFRARPIPEEVIQRFLIKLAQATTIDVYPHALTDNDAGCAAKVMTSLLKTMGKKVYICIPKKGLRGLFAKFRARKSTSGEPSGLNFVLDFNAKERIPFSYRDTFYKQPIENIIGFDHHTQAQDYVEGDIYCDNTARSCCGIIYRLLESLKMEEKIGTKNLQKLYCGMLSDYQKAKLIKFKDNKLIKSKALQESLAEEYKNSKEVLDRIEAQLSEKEKEEVHRYLDVLSNLDPSEDAFRKRLFSSIKTSPNGKLAYIEINPFDKDWANLGMDNFRTSDILRDLRVRLINDIQHDDIFSGKQKKQLKNVEGAIVFYRVQRHKGDLYQMSIHTKGDYAKRLIDEARKIWLKTSSIHFEAGGHDNRAGGRITSYSEEDAKAYVECFVKAAENLG